ncbi:hypothetical protein D3C80_779420 [compost metagenome]
MAAPFSNNLSMTSCLEISISSASPSMNEYSSLGILTVDATSSFFAFLEFSISEMMSFM